MSSTSFIVKVTFTLNLILRYLQWKKDPIKSAKDGRVGCNQLPVGGFWRLNEKSGHPDVQNHVLLTEVIDHATKVSTSHYTVNLLVTFEELFRPFVFSSNT